MTNRKTKTKALPKGSVLSDRMKDILVRRGNPVPVKGIVVQGSVMQAYALRTLDGKPVGPCGLPFSGPDHAADWARRMGYEVVAA